MKGIFEIEIPAMEDHHETEQLKLCLEVGITNRWGVKETELLKVENP